LSLLFFGGVRGPARNTMPGRFIHHPMNKNSSSVEYLREGVKTTVGAISHCVLAALYRQVLKG
jgi:hypothetical protein